MKKLLSIFVLVAMLLATVVIGTSAAAWDGTTASTYLVGEGTAENPYRIASAEDLAFLAKDVDGGNSYEGKYVIQTADIDLGNKEWNPIGTKGKPFSGVYDGKGFKITNMYISANANALGLFGQIQSGTSCSAGVANVNLSGKIEIEELTGDYMIAGLAGYIYDNKADVTLEHYIKVINTVVDVDVTIKKTAKQPRLGGFAGYAYCVDFENCVNKGDISTLETGATSRIGGFVGQTNRSTFTNCVNEGNVTASGNSKDLSTAGFIGMLTDHKDHPENKVIVKNCVNKGNMTTDSTFADESKQAKIYAGGFFAGSWMYSAGLNVEFINCYNSGKISVKSAGTKADSLCFAGGIGSHAPYPAIKVDNCINSGEVTATSTGFEATKAGGIIGGITVDDATVSVTNCTTVGAAVGAKLEKNVVNNNSEEATEGAAAALGKAITDAIAPSVLKIGGFPTEPGSAIPPMPETTIPPETTATPTTEAQTTATPTTEAQTTATPTTEAQTTEPPTTEKPEEKGCGGMLAGSIAVLAIVALGGVVLKKKD